MHAGAYALINSDAVCRSPAGAWFARVPCVDFDALAALLRIDGATPQGRQPLSLNAMLDANSGWILAYFAAIAALSFTAGFAVGKLVERGTIPLTRHRYLFMLEEGRRSGDDKRSRNSGAEARLVRAHVLSRTAHEELVLIYDGVLRDFYSKADGTISYIVLRGARCGAVKITSESPSRAGTTSAMDPTGSGDASTALLVLTSDDVANVYFEHLSAVTKEPGEEKALDEALRKLDSHVSE